MVYSYSHAAGPKFHLILQPAVVIVPLRPQAGDLALGQAGVPQGGQTQPLPRRCLVLEALACFSVS